MPTFFQAEQYYRRGEYAAAKEILDSMQREGQNDRRVTAMLQTIQAADTQIVVTDQANAPSAATHDDWQWLEDGLNTLEVLDPIATNHHPITLSPNARIAVVGLVTVMGTAVIGYYGVHSIIPLILSIQIPYPSSYGMPSGGGSFPLSELVGTSGLISTQVFSCMGLLFGIGIAIKLIGAFKFR